MQVFSQHIMVDDDDDDVDDVDDENSPSAIGNHVSKQVHVLAVDDSIVDRKLIEKLLKISSCKVTAVDSGRRALQFLGFEEGESSPGCLDLKIDLIITDYCMPEMTGHELLKKIKGSSTFRKIPVVIMSSENVCARIDTCLEDGAEEFIVKPVKLSDVERLKKFMALKGQRRRKRKIPEISSVTSPPSSPSHSSHISSTPSPESQALIRLKMA